MAKKRRKASKSKPAKSKPARPKRARAKGRPKAAAGKKFAARKKSARRKAPPRPNKVGSAFRLMIDTINETERLRDKYEPRGSDETA